MNLILTSLEIPPTLITAGVKYIIDKVKHKKPKENILPFKTDHLHKEHSMFCINTHLINTAFAIPIDLSFGLLLSIMKRNVVYFENTYFNKFWKIYKNTNLSILADQAYALDFLVVPNSIRSSNQLLKPDKRSEELSLDTDIVACNDGIVLLTSNMKIRDNKLIEGFLMSFTGAVGNHVVIMHEPGSYSLYAHLQTDSIKVKPGQIVKQGEVIAKLGNTGNSTGPHLHFQMSYLIPKGPLQGLWFGKPLTNFRYEGRCGSLYKLTKDYKNFDKNVKAIMESKPKQYHHESLPFFGFVKEI